MGRARLRWLPISLSLASVAALGSCRDPTQITLQLTTDFDCAKLGANPGTTSISVAKDLASITAPTTTIPSCAAGDRPDDLGSLVLVPSGDGDDVAVEIVAGVGREACAVDASNLMACVVAKRRVRFIEHERLVVPILLLGVCAGITCKGDLTCVDGHCVSSYIDTGKCPNGVCPTGTDAGGPDAIPPDASVGEAGDDAAFDAPLDGVVCTPVGPHPTTPKMIDCPADGATQECPVDSQHCCTNSCQPLSNPCGLKAISTCDETADCPPNTMCCLTVSGGTAFAACALKCLPTDRRLCKNSCECSDCAPAAACGVATCGGTCP